MNIYVDIDGVLLANDDNLAEGAAEFIKYIAENFTVYWLTTHCMHGDPAWAVQYVNRASNEDLSPWLQKFKPTTWSLKKTDAIDFSQPFIWYDDDLFSGEKADLQEHDALNSWCSCGVSTSTRCTLTAVSRCGPVTCTCLPVVSCAGFSWRTMTKSSASVSGSSSWQQRGGGNDGAAAASMQNGSLPPRPLHCLCTHPSSLIQCSVSPRH